MKKSSTIYYTKGNGNELNFYLSTPDGTFYLFTNTAYNSVAEYYRTGKRVSQSMEVKSNLSVHVRKVMEKIPKYIRYIEMTEGITVLEKTKKKQKAKRFTCDGLRCGIMSE